jgi:drug efflux transport system permease protein
VSRVWALTRKELVTVRRDPLTLVLLIGMPAALLLLFGYALTLDVARLPLAVLDRDGSAASRELVGRLTRDGTFQVAAQPRDSAELLRLLDQGEVKVALEIPVDYGRDVALGRPASAQLLLDGSDSNQARVALSHAHAMAQRADVGGLETVELAGAAAPALQVDGRVFFNPALESAQFVVPGLLGIVILVATVLMTAASVARERELGTLEALLATPVGRVELILGKTLPFVALAAADVVLALGTARLVFDVPLRGPLLALTVVTGLYIMGSLGFGVLISTLARNQQAAFQIALMTTLMPAFLLSGFVFPLENMAAPIQALARLVPAQYYIRALRAVVLKGAGVGDLLPDVGALSAFAVVFPALAVIRFRKRLS